MCKFVGRCVASFLFVCLFSQCDDKSDISEKERMTGILTSSAWKLDRVTLDGVDNSDEFTGMTLRFESNTYASTNAVPVWPLSDTWQFADETAREFTRGDEVSVKIENVNDSVLELSLYWDHNTLGTGRAASIRGRYVFYLRR